MKNKENTILIYILVLSTLLLVLLYSQSGELNLKETNQNNFNTIGSIINTYENKSDIFAQKENSIYIFVNFSKHNETLNISVADFGFYYPKLIAKSSKKIN